MACIEGVLAIAAEPAVFCFFVIVDDEVFVPAVMDLVVFWGNDEVIFFVNDAVFAVFFDDVEIVGHGKDVLVSAGAENDFSAFGDVAVAFAGGVFAGILFGLGVGIAEADAEEVIL